MNYKEMVKAKKAELEIERTHTELKAWAKDFFTPATPTPATAFTEYEIFGEALYICLQIRESRACVIIETFDNEGDTEHEEYCYFISETYAFSDYKADILSECIVELIAKGLDEAEHPKNPIAIDACNRT